jgi:predicted transcriptional regulator
MKEYRISVRVNSALRRRLEATAIRTGKRESSLVREALEQQLSRSEAEETAYDLALKAGLIGAVKGGNRDLSTNPRHFDGFGES